MLTVTSDNAIVRVPNLYGYGHTQRITMRRYIIALSPVLLLLTSSLLMACESLIDITIHNQTDETLQIFIYSEVFLANALPGGEVVWEIERIQPRYNVTAKDMDGNTLYTADFTRDDLKGKKLMTSTSHH